MSESGLPQPSRFEQVFQVAPEDIDERGHVNNTVYVRWIQAVAASHWESVATPAQLAELAWVLLRHEIDYKHPALPGDQILARTWVGAAEGAMFDRHTELLRRTDGRLLARSRTVWCPVDARSGRPRRVTPELQGRFYQAGPGGS